MIMFKILLVAVLYTVSAVVDTTRLKASFDANWEKLATHDGDSYDFECFDKCLDNNGNDRFRWNQGQKQYICNSPGSIQHYCCGIGADGKRVCANADKWLKQSNGKYAYCRMNYDELDEVAKTGVVPKDELLDKQQRPWDICCDNENIQSCADCSSFVVWPWATQEHFNKSASLDLNWKEQFTNQDIGELNKIYPVGFKNGQLREKNNPPVCVFIPGSAGKMIEIKVESESRNNRLCISDLQDDVNNGIDPGQGTTCDDFRVKACYPDGSTGKDFAFKITCDSGCEEQTNIDLWYRARHSVGNWNQGHETAVDNIEMWCQYIVDEYPVYNQYPQDLKEEGEMEEQFKDDSGVSSLFSLLSLFMSFVLLLC